MKLLAAALLVAAVSATGCATEDGADGEYLSGLRPAKPSFDSSSQAQFPDVSSNVQLTGFFDLSKTDRNTPMAVSISDGAFPLPNRVCDGCEVTLVTVNTSVNAGDYAVGDVQVVDDGGYLLCTVHVDATGHYDTRDCIR